MKADELREKFLSFFEKKGHKRLPSVSLIPEDDPTILFTPAGMSPLVPYLLGEPHPLGKRLCSVQKCLRTDDIEEVGDAAHFTFFEMLGNWGLGDYFKKQAIKYSFEFLTDKNWLDLSPQKIYISVFEGDQNVPRDEESIKIWQETFKKAGVTARVGDWHKPNFAKGERIFAYSKKENWWGPAGKVGPCGPDTEMFYDTGLPHDKKFGKYCHPNCQCGRFVEMWNDVFMEYNKKIDGSFEPLKQKNVDTGMGLERVVAVTEYLGKKIKTPDPFLTHLFVDLINQIENSSGKKYQTHLKEFRIIADHLRAAVFIIAEGVKPSNKDRGYVLRRLIRRAVFKMHQLNIIVRKESPKICQTIIDNYSNIYLDPKGHLDIIITITEEIDKFERTLDKGVKFLERHPRVDGKVAFDIFQTYGIPFELTQELLAQRSQKLKKEEFDREFKRHQELSRKAFQRLFKGGLANHSEEVIKLHTATHLLHGALRKILGSHVQQVGSNITPKRLRFDFTHPKPLTKAEIKKVEDLVNKNIKKNLKVEYETMTLDEVKKAGALAFFGQKYPEKVKVYSIGKFSKEVCAGPHVGFTGKLGRFMIKKEESSGAGKRRIYAVLKSYLPK